MDSLKFGSGEGDLVVCSKTTTTSPAVPEVASEESFAVVTDESIQRASAEPLVLRSPLDSSFAVVQIEHGPSSSSFVEVTNEKYAEMSDAEVGSSFVVINEDVVRELKANGSQSSDVLHPQNDIIAPADNGRTSIHHSVVEAGGSLTIFDDTTSCDAMPPKAADISLSDGTSKSGNDSTGAHTYVSSTGVDSSFAMVEAMVDVCMIHTLGNGIEDVKMNASESSHDLHHVDDAHVTTGAVYAKGDGVTLETGNRVFVVNHSAEGDPSSVNDSEGLGNKNTDEQSTMDAVMTDAVTMSEAESKPDIGICKTENIDSNAEGNSSNTTCSETSTHSKPNIDLQKSVTGNESKSENSVSNTDGVVPMVTEGQGSDSIASAASGTSCQPTQKGV